MNFNSLKVKIGLHLAILLLIAMFSIDFIVVTTGQSTFAESEIVKGELISAIIQENLLIFGKSETIEIKSGFQPRLNRMIKEYGISSLLVIDKGGRTVYRSNNGLETGNEFVEFTKQAVLSQKKTSRYSGDTWGVFWKQKQNIWVSVPFFKEGSVIGGTGVLIQLDGFYNAMRQSHKVVLLYIITNAVLLTLVGLYRMIQLTINPINRLVKKAEEYRDDNPFVFKAEKEENEFGQLSRSLNRMMTRISKDKEALQHSLSSIESANIEIKKAQKEIIRAEKLASVGRLAAGIAHEIGNPLGIVSGYLGLLKERAISIEEREDYLNRSEAEISRIKSIIRELLDFSRPVEEVTEDVNLHEIIHETAEILKVQPLMNNIRIDLVLSAENDTVHADPDQLRQVFINLMMNAADAISSSENSEAGMLTVETRVTEHPEINNLRPFLTIQIMDNGSGIPAGNLGNIFDPFFTTKEPGEGTGLGLAVSFMIVEQAGGRISAESDGRHGTTFTVCLPLK
ncbi:MAG: ATP-binding protein [Desulfobacterales bacterium]